LVRLEKKGKKAILKYSSVIDEEYEIRRIGLSSIK